MRHLLAVLLVCAVPLAACWVPTEQGQRMERDLDTLRRQLATVRRTHEEDQARLLSRVNMLGKRSEEISHQLAAVDKSAHRGATDVGVELNDLKSALTQLRGEIEMQDFRLGRVEGDVKVMGAKPVTAPKSAAATTSVAASESATAPSPAAPPKPRLPEGKQELLDAGKKALASKEYDNALKLYGRAASRWPTEEGVADRAAIGAGLALAGKGDHRRAIIEYNRVLEKFPRSSYADDALYEIAQAFVALGYPDDARAFLEELVTRHPSSPLRSKARSQMSTLKKKR